MATDLTALVSYKQAITNHHNRVAALGGHYHKLQKKVVYGDGRELQPPVRPEIISLRSSTAYKVF